MPEIFSKETMAPMPMFPVPGAFENHIDRMPECKNGTNIVLSFSLYF